MNVFDTVRVVVYRFHEKGLEIFLVNSGLEEENWRIPFTDIAKYTEQDLTVGDRFIAIESNDTPEGPCSMTCAIEGDWHDIPSIRKLIKEDIKLVSTKIDKYVIPELEKGTYFAIKEAFKKVMPNEYKILHELKDILLHRNMVKNM
jgi:hypothetical protein